MNGIKCYRFVCHPSIYYFSLTRIFDIYKNLKKCLSSKRKTTFNARNESLSSWLRGKKKTIWINLKFLCRLFIYSHTNTSERLVCGSAVFVLSSVVTYFAFHFGTASVNRETHLAFVLLFFLLFWFAWNWLSFGEFIWCHSINATHTKHAQRRHTAKSSLSFASIFVWIRRHGFE